MTKREQMNVLYNNYKKEFDGKEIVLGSGNLDAKLFLIGEAPGKDEVKQQKPFVGAAGKNLTEFLNVLGLQRDSIYISNAIKYRLSRMNPKTGRLVNRPALRSEIVQGRKYLYEEIGIIKPDIIVTLGNVPLTSVTNEQDACIGGLHGKERQVNILSSAFRLFPLYHPASIIYNRGLKEIYINDIYNLKGLIMEETVRKR